MDVQDTVLQLIKNAMEKAVASGKTSGFLIDGYPRDIEQGKEFEQKVANPLLFEYLSNLYFRSVSAQKCSSLTQLSQP